MAATVYALKVTLRHVRPPIWRRLRVPGAVSLDKLHSALQIALGWSDSHLHQFRVGDVCYGMRDPVDGLAEDTLDERKVRLEQIASLDLRMGRAGEARRCPVEGMATLVALSSPDR